MHRPRMVCPLGNLPTDISRTSHRPEFVVRARRFRPLPAPASQFRSENWNRILAAPVEVVLTPAAARKRQAIGSPELGLAKHAARQAIKELVYMPHQGPLRRLSPDQIEH